MGLHDPEWPSLSPNTFGLISRSSRILGRTEISGIKSQLSAQNILTVSKAEKGMNASQNEEIAKLIGADIDLSLQEKLKQVSERIWIPKEYHVFILGPWHVKLSRWDSGIICLLGLVRRAEIAQSWVLICMSLNERIGHERVWLRWEVCNCTQYGGMPEAWTTGGVGRILYCKTGKEVG